jgi:serine/threonine-protein kinase
MELTSATPATIGKYQIRGVLGRGAMGTVYDGWDPVIGRRVAIKTVRLLDEADSEALEGLERFKREAQAAGRLSHPNIVGVYDYGETAETAYIVMEFVEGQSLKQMLDARERFPVAETVRIMEQVLAGLQFSHDSGVIHRDIKPGNVMIAKGGRVKLADFGIARIESSVMTQDGTMLGTPAYMSPEQLMAQTVDSRSDIYSAGVVLYQMLTGERPFEGGLTAIIHKALNTVPPRPSEISVTAPANLDAVVARAMAKRPGDRYPDADSFARAMRAAFEAPDLPLPACDAAAEDEATLVTRPAATPAPAPAPRPAAAPVEAPLPPASKASGGPNIAVLGGIAAVVLLAIGGGAWFMLQPSSPTPTPLASTAAPSSQTVTVTQSKPEAPAAPPIVAEPAPKRSAEAPAAPAAKPEPPPTPPAVSSPPTTTEVAPTPTPTPTAPTPTAPTPAPPPTPAASVPSAPPPAATATVPPPASAPEAPAETPPTPAPSPSPPPQVATIVPPNPQAIRDALAALSLSANCALPRFSVSDEGWVNVYGIVGAGGPDAALRAAVQKAAAGTQLSWLMRPVDGPYCDALDLIRPIAQPSSPPLGLTLKDDITHLHDGDAIRPIVKLPDFPAHLQVDYLSHDGSILHLFPDASHKDKVFAANAVVPLGDPKLGVGAVGPPFGTDMILAIASSAPLFAQRRPDEDTVAAYLPALRAALDAAQAKGVRLTGRALPVDTVAK